MRRGIWMALGATSYVECVGDDTPYGDLTSFPREVAEMALAHTIKDKTEAVYRRKDALERRRRLMQEWATYCETPKATGDNVTPIGKASGKAG